MDEEGISPEELAQALTGPNRFALQWIQATSHNQIEVVWPQMTRDFRLAMTQAWLSYNPAALQDPSVVGLTRDELASALAAESPDHALFRNLAQVSLREIRNAYGNMDTDQLVPGLHPRAMGMDLEVVRLFYLPDLDRDKVGDYIFAAGAVARSAPVWVRQTAPGWAVAGIGEGLLHPGWPPTYERMLRPED
jgi:hypothetical protein